LRGLAAAALGSTLACSSYVATHRQLRAAVRDGRYAEAHAVLDALEDPHSRLLQLYERGLVLHEQGELAASDSVLDRAEELAADLYTRSVTNEAAALLVSEGRRDYRGEAFELDMLHYYRIQNHLGRDDLESAAVQCRRLDLRLDRLEDEGRAAADAAFFRYLTGLVYAASGDGNDADVSFRKALGASDSGTVAPSVPPRLYCDLAANAARLGDRAEAERYREAGGCPPPDGRRGVLRLFLECGTVAFRDANEALLPIFKGEIHDDLDTTAYARTLAGRCGQPHPPDVEVDYLLRISLPTLVETPSGIDYVRVTALGSDGEHGESTVLLPGVQVTERARAAFAAAQGAILLRATVRGLAKYLAAQAAEKKGGDAARWAVDILGLATETADTRCWSTLPEKILSGSLDLAPGRTALRVELMGRDGRLDDSFEIPAVEISAGRETFLNYRLY
jgi:hypothetical protein